MLILDNIKEDLAEVLNEIYTEQNINPDFARGIVKVIYKKGDTKRIQNY